MIYKWSEEVANFLKVTIFQLLVMIIEKENRNLSNTQIHESYFKL